MPSTNKTNGELQLTQYIGTDIIDFIQDYNADMDKLAAHANAEKAREGVANGFAMLDSTGKLAQMPTATDVGARDSDWLPSPTDIGAQPKTVARGIIVKADASGNLVPAEEGKDFLKPNSTALVNAVYPVGSIYISVTNTNPAYLFGGTWAAFGTGRTLVGVDTTQNEFNTVQKTGGSKTHTLTLSQIPPHSHKTVEKMGYIFYGGERAAGPAEGNGYATDSNTLNTGSAGGGEAHNNLQPYITVYMWRRIA